jgi:hypothetical protein
MAIYGHVAVCLVEVGLAGLGVVADGDFKIQRSGKVRTAQVRLGSVQLGRQWRHNSQRAPECQTGEARTCPTARRKVLGKGSRCWPVPAF